MNVQPQDLRELVSDGLDRVEEVARFLKLSRSRVYELMDAGELPYLDLRSFP
jgi:predicted DNA-binding transcriptional regulator AlpA